MIVVRSAHGNFLAFKIGFQEELAVITDTMITSRDTSAVFVNYGQGYDCCGG